MPFDLALQKCARAPRTQCVRSLNMGKFWTVAWIVLFVLSYVFPSARASKRRPGASPGTILQREVGSVPAARSGASMVWFAGKVLLFEGVADGGTFTQYFGAIWATLPDFIWFPDLDTCRL